MRCWTSGLPNQRGAPEAADQVIVDHPDGLHERIADGGSHELEAAAQKLLAHGVRLRRACGNLAERFPGIQLRLPVDKLPDKRVEAAEFVLNFAKRLGIADRRKDL